MKTAAAEWWESLSFNNRAGVLLVVDAMIGRRASAYEAYLVWSDLFPAEVAESVAGGRARCLTTALNVSSDSGSTSAAVINVENPALRSSPEAGGPSSTVRTKA